MIRHWKDNIKLTDDNIVRSFKRGFSARDSLDPTALDKILKFLQRKAKLHDIGERSGHSCGMGAAIDLRDRGVPLERIMLRGEWNPDNTALWYLRNWDDSNWLLARENY